ncbi:hypothetical protein RB195_023289 [Necator americanus]|uniref:Uncharacterized protein n=1 Tax=Necator americanus TaxID=51031 RepID=A0ABR1EIR0_NECAM
MFSPPTLDRSCEKNPGRRFYRRKGSQCKNVVTFTAENAQTYLDVNIRGRSLRFDTGGSRWYHVERGSDRQNVNFESRILAIVIFSMQLDEGAESSIGAQSRP